MEENDLNILLENTEGKTVEKEEFVSDIITKLKLDEVENKVEIKTTDSILKTYTDNALEIEKIKIQMEEFKEKNREIFDIIDKFNNSISEIEEKQILVKNELTDLMGKLDKKNIQNDYFKVTYVAQTTRENFDKKAFEKKYPVLYKTFIKKSDVSAYIKITEVK